MIYSHLTPTGHPLPFLGQVKQTCPKVEVAPPGFVDDPAPKPNYLPGVEPELVPGQAKPQPPPPPPPPSQEDRFLPITIAVIAVRLLIALVRRAPP